MTRPPPDEPTEKYCTRVRTFEVHDGHEWEKRGFKYYCIGVPSVDEQPPCQIVDNGVVCGKPSPVEIHVKTEVVDTKVDVCIFHKRQHDRRAAAIRHGQTLPRAS